VITSVQVTNTTCGLDNGTILILASGGVGQLEYFIDGQSYGDVNYTENWPAGSYLVTVQDENGCSASKHIVIDPSSGPSLDIYITPSHCGKSDGQIELDAFNGTAPYTYSFDGGPFRPVSVFVNLPTGFYMVAVKDAKGCIYEEEVYLNEAPGPKITNVTVVDPDCGSANGKITVTATGTELKYSIHLPVYQDSAVFYPVAPGTYTITVKDKWGCTVTAPAVVNPKPAPIINDVIVVPTSCGMNLGSIQVLASGGVAPLMYALDNGPFGTSNIFNSLPAGAYVVKVKGANGCETSRIVVIESEGGIHYGNVSATICEGSDYILQGDTFTLGGIYNISLPGGAFNGCDSVIILTLTVDPLNHRTISSEICQGDSLNINGIDYSLPDNM
jgi:hypothetical protein